MIQLNQKECLLEHLLQKGFFLNVVMTTCLKFKNVECPHWLSIVKQRWKQVGTSITLHWFQRSFSGFYDDVIRCKSHKHLPIDLHGTAFVAVYFLDV